MVNWHLNETGLVYMGIALLCAWVSWVYAIITSTYIPPIVLIIELAAMFVGFFVAIASLFVTSHTDRIENSQGV